MIYVMYSLNDFCFAVLHKRNKLHLLEGKTDVPPLSPENVDAIFNVLAEHYDVSDVKEESIDSLEDWILDRADGLINDDEFTRFMAAVIEANIRGGQYNDAKTCLYSID